MGQQQRHLLRVQHDRQAIGRRDPRHAVTEAGPAQRDMEEEPQRRAGQVHPGVARAERSHVKLIAPQILRLGPVRRQAEEGRELADLSHIIALRVLAKPADGHVLDHPLAQRTDGDGNDHGGLRGSGETTPKSSDAAPHRRNLSDERAAAPSRESGLVRWRNKADASLVLYRNFEELCAMVIAKRSGGIDLQIPGKCEFRLMTASRR